MKALKEARTHRRWWAQVARLIALADPGIGVGPVRLGVLGFNVHAARSYAERLIAEGERLELERVTFMDWTRTQPGPVPEGLSMSQGMGPENRERGAFVRVDIDADWTIDDNGDHHALPKRGGWPGPLAREWGTVRCEACARGCANCGSPARAEVIAGDDGEWFCSTACHDDHDENSCPLERGFGEVQRRRRRLHGDHCGSCKGRGYIKYPKREAAAANGGAWMIRVGRRLLAALEGQPSECRECDGSGEYAGERFDDDDPGDRPDCDDCRGTGHNLSGTLPAFVLPCETYNAHVLARAERQHAERCRASAIASFAERMRRASAHATD